MLFEALTLFIAVDNARASVTVGELPQFKHVHKIGRPNCKKAIYAEAKVFEGAEVLTLRPEEQGSQMLFVATSKIPSDGAGLCSVV